MHQRSTASYTRHWLSGFLSLLLVSGCLPSPTKAPTGPKASGLQVAGKPVASPSAAPSEAPTGNNLVPTLPIEVKAPIISHNGGNVIQGTVMAPAKIISHNGGNIIGNNGGNIISHNGGNIISHNGGNIIGNNGSGFKISQVPLAYATVRLKDAAGNPVKDDQGNELITKTDEKGNYKFPVDVKGRNLVVHAEVPGQKADLVALLPKEGVTAETSVSVDMASTLTLSYILELYVKGDLATFEKLPKDLESKARVQTEEAIVKGAIALPETLEREELISTIAIVLNSDQTTKATFEEIRRILVVAGVQNEGDGLPATEIPVSTVDGVISDSAGNYYIFSRSRHTLWRVNRDGIAHTLVPQGKWGYSDTENDKIGDYFISGMAFDFDGSLLIADTYYHRIVRITKDSKVSVVAGLGKAGFSGDGMNANDASLNRPTGLAVQNDGTILFCDSGNHRIRRIRVNGKIETFAGNGTTGPITNSQRLAEATFHNPQSLSIANDGSIYVADANNNSVRRIADEFVTTVGHPGQFARPTSLAFYGGMLYLLCANLGGLYRLEDQIQMIDEDNISDGTYSLTSFGNKKILVATEGGVVVNNDGRLFSWDGKERLTHIFGVRASVSKNYFVLAKGICVSGEDVYVSDLAQHKIFKVGSNGELERVIGNGISEQYLESSLDLKDFPLAFPFGLSVTRDGGMLISSISNFPVVRKLQPSGELKTIIGNGKISYTSFPSGSALGVPLTSPYEAVENSDGEIVFLEPEQNRMSVMNVNGVVSTLFPGEDLKYPASLTLDQMGKLNYVEMRGNRIVRLEGNARETRFDYSSFSPELDVSSTIREVAFDSEGNAFVATQRQVLRVAPNGKKTLVAGIGGVVLNGETKDSGLFEVEGLVVTPSGDLLILETTQLKKVPAALLSTQ